MGEYYCEDYFTFFEEEDRQRYIRKLEHENAILRSRLNALLKVKQDVRNEYEERIEALEKANKTLSDALKKTYGTSFLRDAGNNNEIRAYAKLKGVRLWMVGEKMGISEYAMSRLLREKLSTEEKAKIISLIDSLAEKDEEDVGC